MPVVHLDSPGGWTTGKSFARGPPECPQIDHLLLLLYYYYI